jgi:hypothetical protein
MRSMNSFGVAGLLSQKCDVFYSNDLRARNIGRVSDLVSAKLRETNVDELRIRALLVYGIFQAYALRELENHHDESIPPVSVEIGIDPVHIAVAIAFHWDEGKAPKWKGLGKRVDAEKGENPFEKILESISRHSTQILVRYEMTDRRIEIVSLLHRQNVNLHDPTMVVAVDAKSAPLLEVSNYTELGDLNFSKLLRNPVDSGNEVVENRTPQETIEEIRIGGGAGAAEPEIRFSKNAELDPKAFQEVREEYEATINELKNTVHELKERLESAENAASERRFGGNSSMREEESILVKGTPPPEEGKKDDWGFHFLKQVWPFSPKEAAVSDGGTPHDPEAVAEIVAPIESRDEEDGEDGPHSPSEAERAAEHALKELQELAKSQKSKKVEATLNEIEEEVAPDKAKRWVDSLSSELLHEKARLAELQRNLTKEIRQRELEFKTSERALKQELKRKEEMISHRQTAIENKNDQIAQLNLAVERASANTNDKETQQIKVKLDRAQRMSQMKEEEAKALLTKVRDLENRLIIAQAKAQKGNDLQMATKVQGLERKIEEYKRVNHRLMESLNSQKEKSNDKEVGDLRRKIDQLDRLNTEAKRNLEKTAFKVRELQESERKLQGDLARAIEENRNLRKAGSRGSGESGHGGQAA